MVQLGYRARLALTYGVDWFLAVLVAAFANFYLDQFQQIPDFDLTDTSIQYAFKEKQVVSNQILAFMLFIPYGVVIAGNLLLARKQWWDFHMALLGLTVTYSFTGSAVEAIRITVGRPRPDFIARCNPKPDAANGKFFGLAKVSEVCQTPLTDHIIVDGMRSFFSGHAFLLAGGLGFASLYVAGKMHIFNRKAYTAKLWLLVVPTTFTGWVCLTRVTDRRHHWQDVAFGFIAGVISAYVVYRQFYPPLDDTQCHLPYAPRIAPKEVRQRLHGEGLPQHTSLRSWFNTRHLDSTTVGDRGSRGDLEEAGLITTPFNPEFDQSTADDHRPSSQFSPNSYPLEPVGRRDGD